MQVSKISNSYVNLAFQRKLRDDEKMEYRNDTIRQAYNFLGIKDVSMIMHGTSFPVSKNDIGVGSPFNSLSKDVVELERLHGFTSEQLGPLGEITKKDISPYASTVWAKNKLFIDFNALTTDKYANILDKESVSNFSVPYDGKNNIYEYSKFYEAFENSDILLNIAYDNFLTKLGSGNKNAIALNNEYTKFKHENNKRLLKEATFTVLSKIYGTDDFEEWESDLDRNLPERLDVSDPEAISRFKYLIDRNGRDFKMYAFTQFLINKQMAEHKKYRENIGFKYNADELVGTSKMEEYIYKDAFLKNMRMGCQFGGPYGPQLWDFPVPDPKKLFNSDGSLGAAGKFIKAKLESALNDCENVRIDHVFGIINPYVYDKNSVVINNGQMDCGKFRGGYLSQMHDLDPNGDYWKILEKIILPTMREHGVDPNDAVWEDLGTRPEGFDNLFYNILDLPGITELGYQRAENAGRRKNWSYMGSHDSWPALKLVKDGGYLGNQAWAPEYLAGFLNSDPTRSKERIAFQDKIVKDPMERIKAKFADLFMCSDKIQISFADFFGIDKVYNYGGQDVKTNWKLRLSKNFEDAYYKNLSSDHPTALNLPEILKIAVRAKIDREVVQKMQTDPDNADTFRKSINARMQPLLDRLDKFEHILKEKEN